MSKILLTGASGFIGTHTRKALREAGYELVSLIRTPGNFVSYPSERILVGTLAEPETLERNLAGLNIDACVHLAWEGIPDYSSIPSMKNLEYGFHVLRLCKKLGIKRLVIAGSCWEYLAPSGMVSENASLSYENPFKAAKNTLHTMAEEFCRENGIACHWLRFFYVYGEGQRSGSLIPYIVSELRNSVLPALNGAFNRNDFVHVSDVAHAVCKSLEYMRAEVSCETFNIGSGFSLQVLEVVSETARLLCASFDPSYYEQPAVKPVNFWANTQAAQTKLHWKPRILLSEGLQRYITFTN